MNTNNLNNLSSLSNLNNLKDYHQPDFYHFNEDSLIVKDLASHYLNELSSSSNNISNPVQILDLCAGCGIIGLELLTYHHNTFNSNGRNLSITFNELQDSYHSYFQKNLNAIDPNGTTQTSWINAPMSNLQKPEFKEQYDLIVSNPPYFEKENGRLSNNHSKNICRFFMEDNFEIFFNVIEHCLKWDGRAFFSCRLNEDEVSPYTTSSKELKTQLLKQDGKIYYYQLKKLSNR
jgi:tRNA1Val (adenine37-N6)-methyltransferase